jgi:hypothetical protein
VTDRAEAGKRRVVAVAEEAETLSALRRLWSEDAPAWELVVLPQKDAGNLLAASRELQQVLGYGDDRAAEEYLRRFSRLVNDVVPAPADDDRAVVVSHWPVPLDLAVDSKGDWGGRSIFSHVLLPEPAGLAELRRSISEPEPSPLGAYLLVCPMAVDRLVPRHLQDIVQVATELEDKLPVELWLQPSLDRALQSFEQRHASVLHIDTHGSPLTIMMGPTRDGGEQVDQSLLPARIAAPLVIVVGCDLTGDAHGIGAELVRRGAAAAFGSFITFRSLGITGAEETEAEWYRVLLRALIDGHDLGHAVLAARRAAGSGTLRYCWLTLGSSLLRFRAAAPLASGGTEAAAAWGGAS